ncbi:MAG: hypothetical protein ACRCSF_06420 [Mycobacteriaceae bacterium]
MLYPTFEIKHGINRRSSIRLASFGLAVLGVGSINACSQDGGQAVSNTPDLLIAQAKLARADARDCLAAITLLPERAESLSTASAERTAHAVALETEIARIQGTEPNKSAADSNPIHSLSPSNSPNPIPILDLGSLQLSIGNSAKEAANAAIHESGYHAGLLGSISASCSALLKVQLA